VALNDAPSSEGQRETLWYTSGDEDRSSSENLMNTLEAVRIALQSLWANKLRSVLTLLGVVIAVATVIAVMTFVNGINGFVAEKIFNRGLFGGAGGVHGVQKRGRFPAAEQRAGEVQRAEQQRHDCEGLDAGDDGDL
jgi:hypothetical protein